MDIHLDAAAGTATITARNAVERALLREAIAHLQESGRLELPSHLSEVVALFESFDSLTTSDAVELIGGVTLTAMSNRLIRLHRMGLLTRTSAVHSSGGREFVYSLAEQEPLQP